MFWVVLPVQIYFLPSFLMLYSYGYGSVMAVWHPISQHTHAHQTHRTRTRTHITHHTHTLHTHTTHTQKVSADDPLGKLLKDLREPNEDNLKSKAMVKLDLIQIREHLGLSEDLIGGRVCLYSCIQGFGRSTTLVRRECSWENDFTILIYYLAQCLLFKIKGCLTT